MPEIGALNNKQVASLAGLAPMSQSSVKWPGKARIQGGRRPNLRNAIVMPALVAFPHNADLKAKYDQLVVAEKEKKVAITAVMRNGLSLRMLYCTIIGNGWKKRLDQDGYSSRQGFSGGSNRPNVISGFYLDHSGQSVDRQGIFGVGIASVGTDNLTGDICGLYLHLENGVSAQQSSGHLE